MRRSWLPCAVLAVALPLAGVAPAAHAAPRLSLSSSTGGATAALDGPTRVDITGSGFQSLPNAFGGLYLMFGWVSDPDGGGWRPSRGGTVGRELLYVDDSETADNHGYQRFVAFPGATTSDSANGGEISAEGGIELSLVIPGPTFTAQDRDGNSQLVDCREVQCGIITIGAHGVANANNESFTPVSFVGPKEQEPTRQEQQAPSTEAPPRTGASAKPDAAAGAADGGASATPEPEVPATLGLSPATIQAGRVLAFTGQGFDPGEQVVATVGAGLAGVGPLTAGRFGEVAGALTLPTEIRPGSHVVTLSAAGSGKVAEATVTVMADPSVVSAGDAALAQAEQPGPGWTLAAWVVSGVAGLLLLFVAASLVSALLRRRGRGSRGGKVRVRKVDSK